MGETLYPIGYGTRLVTMAELRAVHEPRMHPAYARRLFPWIEAQGGAVGIGGGVRELGEQPDKPGFAPEGRSFHQPQQFPSGAWFAAVDLVVRNPGRVHRAPSWAEVPAQGSADARRWGVHANVSTESWHMQPIELDGWQSWVNAGRPDLDPSYPIPIKETPDMQLLMYPPRAYTTRPTDAEFVAGTRALAPGERRTVTLPTSVPAGATQVQLNVKAEALDGPDAGTAPDPGWLRFLPGNAEAGRATHSDVNWWPGQVGAAQVVEVGVAARTIVIENGPAPCHVVIDVKGYVD